MLVFKKVVAAIFMILSIIAIVVLIVALFGSWAVKARLETTSIELLLAGENVVEVTRDGLARVDEVLDTSTAIVEEVDVKVRQLGEDAQDSDPLFAQILDSIGIDLKSGIESAFNSFTQIEANIMAINDAVDAVRDIPILGLDNRMPSVTKLQEVESQMAQLRQDVTGLAQAVKDNRSNLIDGKIGAVTDITTGLYDNMNTTRTDLNEADARLAESADSMAELREKIPGLYTTITVVINLIFLLSIVAFVSLFLHAWQYFKCAEDGLRGLMPGDCEKAPAAA